MTDSLRKRAIKGVFWTSIETVGARSVQFVIGIVLARLLLPKEFGLIGMLAIFMAIAQVFLDSGFGSALIQKQNATQVDICSIFYFNIAVGLATSGLLCLAAPLISSFYNQPSLIPLTRVLSLTIVFNSLGLIQNTFFRKIIDFRVVTMATLIAGVLSGSIGISLAIYGYGVWSLAVQQVSSTLFRTVVLWFMSSWRPALIFSFRSLKEMFGFGSRILASGLLNQTFNNIYLLVIGKVFSATELGFFTRAQRFQELPSQSLSGIITKVTFPVFSSIQDDPDRLKRGMKKALTSLVLINFPMMIGLAVVSRPLIIVLLTEKWLGCVWYLQLLCMSGMMYPLHVMNLNVLQSLGRSDLFLRLEIIKKIFIVINIAVTWRWGIQTMIMGQVVVSVISYYLNCYYNGILIGYSICEQLRDLAAYFTAAVLMGIGIHGLVYIPFQNIGLLLVTQIVVGIVLYSAICRMCKFSAFMELYQAALNRILRRKVMAG